MSTGNYEKIVEAKTFGCYHCIQIFNSVTNPPTPFLERRGKVKGFKTALCPKCQIDSCIPNPESIEQLKVLNELKFLTQ